MDRRKVNIHIQQISQESDICPTLVQIKNWSWTLWFLNMSTCLPFENWIMFYFGTPLTYLNASHKMVISFFALSQHEWIFFTFMQSMKTMSLQFETKTNHYLKNSSYQFWILSYPSCIFQTLFSNPSFSTTQSF
jgi:hypothetical protein